MVLDISRMHRQWKYIRCFIHMLTFFLVFTMNFQDMLSIGKRAVQIMHTLNGNYHDRNNKATADTCSYHYYLSQMLVSSLTDI